MKQSKLILCNSITTANDLNRFYKVPWTKLFPKRVKLILGEGLIWGVFIFDKNGIKLDNSLTNKICEKAMEKGVFSICTGRGTLKLGPPLTIPESALIEGLNVYEECLKKML